MKPFLFLLILPLLSCARDNAEKPVPVDPGKTFADSVSFVTVEFRTSNKSAWMTSRYAPYNEGDADNDFNVNSSNTALIDNLKWFGKTEKNEMDKWGGHKEWIPDEITSSNTAGFWRTGTFRGRPVMVDPDGHVAILHGVNTVSPGKSSNYSATAKANYLLKYSNAKAWGRDMASFVYANAINFYTGGMYYTDLYRDGFSESDEKYFQTYRGDWSPSHIETLSFMRTFQGRYSKIHPGQKLSTDISRFALLFDPSFDEELEKFLNTVTGYFKGEKNLIGYYLDNELAFLYEGSSIGEIQYNPIKLSLWLAYSETTDAAKAAKAYAVKFMTDRGLEPLEKNISKALQTEFLAAVTELYFSKLCSAVRRHDPDHLILGCRLHGLPSRTSTVVRLCAQYCDVLSKNYYSRWDPEEPYMAWIQKFLGKKPFIISEFYTKDDNYEFNNADGAGWIVHSQQDRGKFYQNFCIRLLRGGCAGWQWFELMDKGEEGSSNKGLITVDYNYEKYNDFLQLYSQMNLNVYKVFDWLNNPQK